MSKLLEKTDNRTVLVDLKFTNNGDIAHNPILGGVIITPEHDLIIGGAIITPDWFNKLPSKSRQDLLKNKTFKKHLVQSNIAIMGSDNGKVYKQIFQILNNQSDSTTETADASTDSTEYPLTHKAQESVKAPDGGYNSDMSKTNHIDDLIDDPISAEGMSKKLHIPIFLSKFIIELSVYFGSFRRFYVVESGSTIIGIFQKEKNANEAIKTHKNSKLRLVYGQPK